MDATLGIDVGTTTAKAAVMRADGRLLSEASTAYPTSHLGPGLVEQEAEDWWTSAADAARKAMVQVQEQTIRICGIGVSGQGCALTPVSSDGTPLRRAIIWMDTRSHPQVQWMEQHAGAAIRRANGNRVGPFNVDPKILWLREHEPAVYEDADVFLTTTAFVTMRLAGVRAMNRSDGGILCSYDLSRNDWSDEVLTALDIPRSKLPAVSTCQAVVGELQAPAAEALHLEPGIPVVAGGEDTSSAALAAGVVRPGASYLSLGTAGVVGVCLDRPLMQPNLLSFPHVVDGTTLLSGSMSSIGAAVRWFRENLGPAGDSADPNRALSDEAASSAPGAGGLVFLPYLSGELHPILDPFARGTFVGISLTTTRADMIRAVMEGGAFAVRHNLDTAAEVGAVPTRLHAVGGPTRSAVWCQILADITGLPVQVMEASGGAPAGNALLAAYGVGLIDDLTDFAEKRTRPSATYQPGPGPRSYYDALYGVYRRTYTALKEEFRTLADISSMDRQERETGVPA